MVTVIGYQLRKTAAGNTFVVLELEGGLQTVQSQNGATYASVLRCTLPCSFDESTAQRLVGSTLPGTIARKSCMPYSYTNPRTGESMTLNFQYSYVPPVENQKENSFRGQEII